MCVVLLHFMLCVLCVYTSIHVKQEPLGRKVWVNASPHNKTYSFFSRSPHLTPPGFEANPSILSPLETLAVNPENSLYQHPRVRNLPLRPPTRIEATSSPSPFPTPFL
eukprot:Hpha_TRINITY_DN14521_c0_g1::TRINITY_DN14521_c0_g1_i2::g.46594::m.46594